MDQVADTSELFLRAQQLVRFCEVARRQTKADRNFAPARRESGGELKIGEHVRQTMVQLANTGKLTPKVVADLSDRSHCESIFGLNHSFLRKVVPDAPLHAQGIDENGYSRYWRNPFDIDGAPVPRLQSMVRLGTSRVRPMGSGTRVTRSSEVLALNVWIHVLEIAPRDHRSRDAPIDHQDLTTDPPGQAHTLKYRAWTLARVIPDRLAPPRRKSRGVKIATPSNGSSARRSLSPVTMQIRFAVDCCFEKLIVIGIAAGPNRTRDWDPFRHGRQVG
jgi:hypothetical protein